MSRIDPATRIATARSFTCLLLAILVVLPAFCYAADPANSAYVYVGWFDTPSSTTAQYHITGFVVAADGSTQTISGSPYLGPSRDLTAVSNHLFGDDGRYIQTYNVAANGSLTATSRVNDLPGNLGGSWEIYALNPDRAGEALNTVVSCGSCNSFVFPWAIGAQGQLSYVGGPGLPGGPAKWSGVITLSPDNRFAYSPGWEGDFYSFSRNINGSLTWINPGFIYAPPLPDWQEQVCQVYTVASSAQGYVTLVWGGSIGCTGGYILGNYTVASNGLLQLVPGSGFVPQVGANTMAYDATGTYLAVAGNGIQIYRLQTDGTATPATGAIQVPGSPGYEQVLWDNAGHVYALTQDCFSLGDCEPNHGLYIFNFDGQSLTLAPGSPHFFARGISLAVLPTS